MREILRVQVASGIPLEAGAEKRRGWHLPWKQDRWVVEKRRERV